MRHNATEWLLEDVRWSKLGFIRNTSETEFPEARRRGWLRVWSGGKRYIPALPGRWAV
jgi:hypothetical protein